MATGSPSSPAGMASTSGIVRHGNFGPGSRLMQDAGPTWASCCAAFVAMKTEDDQWRIQESPIGSCQRQRQALG